MEENIVTLVDEEGKESSFEIVGNIEHEGNTYFALVPVDGNGEEYVVLKGVHADGADEDEFEDLVSIEDDNEFNAVADIFDQLFVTDEDYDA